MKRILALDYGQKRIGLAISDPTGIIARPYGLINEPEKAIKKIKEICQKEKIKEIVVGLPLNMKGEEGIQVQKTKAFVSELQKEVFLPIIFEDERLTTKEADKILREMKVKARKEKIDTLSALLILEQYLGGKE
ncbi:MAG: Holliday junction resolvase RuvX [Candidatus Berkelbacteria bacterium]|nr:Holliday junction resolvase RuvX [Candidatus Berkelbacteria bacterium]